MSKPMDRLIIYDGDGITEVALLPSKPPPFDPDPAGGSDGGGHGSDDGRSQPPLSNAFIGMLMFLGVETMFFAGLLGSFLIFRLASRPWPPPSLPRLPVVVTGVNTLILLSSAFTMWRAQQAIQLGKGGRVAQQLTFTAVLGGTFLVIQGYEWVRLLRFGLTVTSGVYGATFYILIGCHGLHVLGAVIWLLSVLFRVRQGSYTATRSVGMALCGMYWYYVVALWPVLYGLVYLY